MKKSVSFTSVEKAANNEHNVEIRQASPLPASDQFLFIRQPSNINLPSPREKEDLLMWLVCHTISSKCVESGIKLETLPSDFRPYTVDHDGVTESLCRLIRSELNKKLKPDDCYKVISIVDSIVLTEQTTMSSLFDLLVDKLLCTCAGSKKYAEFNWITVASFYLLLEHLTEKIIQNRQLSLLRLLCTFGIQAVELFFEHSAKTLMKFE